MGNGWIGFRIDPEIDRIVRQVAKKMGISTSEYIRKLILEDLEKKSILTARIKEAIKV